jgi:serine/threonine protein kinase
MYVLNLCQQQKIIIPKVGKRLGDGADGEVFVCHNDPNKVIKFSVLYERNNINVYKHFFKKINEVLTYLTLNVSDTYAKVIEHQYLGQYDRKTDFGLQEYVIYYYIMERLNRLSEDEYKVFHTLISHEDKNISKNFSPDKVQEMLKGLSRGLDFNAERVTFFCNNFKNTPIIHQDIHVRNILKDDYGNFKMIDFDRAQLKMEI